MEAPQETENQRRARERRERRQAKITAQGASRLEAITSLSGRPAPAVEDATPAPKPAAATTNANAAPTAAPDPAEVDISEHYYEPTRRALPPSSGTSTPLGARTGSSATDSPAAMDDPMMRMMQQMLSGGMEGGGPGAPGGGAGGAGAGEDPMLKMMQAMMGIGGPQAQQQAQAQAAEQAEADAAAATSSARVWRVVHAVFSFALAAYIALTSTFNGSKLSRSQSVFEDGGVGPRLFWMFATAEVVLQSSRFFLEKGRLQQGGIMGTLSTVLPEPYAGYVRMVGRYGVIYTTVVSDAMVVVFVLGVMAWWQGLVVS